MKIALIIFRIGPSHGSILQTYALHKVLTDMGHNVTIIDRQRPLDIKDEIKKNLFRLYCCVTGKYKGPVFYIGENSGTSMKELRSFVNRYISPNCISISTNKEVASIPNANYECYIIGSDQTWRPNYVYDIYYYYLDFLDNNVEATRIAYAPSFGTSVWEYNDEQTHKCQALVKRFSAVSVREEEGIELCRKYLDVNADFVLDPTLLLHMNDYLTLIKGRNHQKKYIAYSLLDDLDISRSTLTNLSSLLHADLHRLNSDRLNPKNKKDYVEPSIEKWLEGINNASFVVTDSFHATVFSILFNVPFVTVINKNRGASRIFSLLKMCGLEDRWVAEKRNIDVDSLLKPINWDYVNNKLEICRSKSIQWLKISINKK